VPAIVLDVVNFVSVVIATVGTRGDEANLRIQGERMSFCSSESKGENLMKNKLLLSMVAASALLIVPAIGSSGDKSAEVRTLTGFCLRPRGLTSTS
jgi:hypothetical protein